MLSSLTWSFFLSFVFLFYHWMQCTSELQPSLDRARSASTNCLRPDTSLHSPERERYKIKTFWISYHLYGVIFYFFSFFFSSQLLCFCFMWVSQAYPLTPALLLSTFPSRSTHPCRNMCMCLSLKHTYAYFHECCCKWRDVTCNCSQLPLVFLLLFSCLDSVTQGAFGMLIRPWVSELSEGGRSIPYQVYR